jgi:DNA invertase Pin-like site-specific DNA recombinase
MKKVILLVRVSTIYQDYEAQKQQLIDYAIKDNYSIDEMVIIEDKESATKLSEEERHGLTKMYGAINDSNNQIECVYCWELSRLSRNELMLIKLKNYFVEKRINFICLNPSLVLLDNKKQLKTDADLLFNLFISLCKTEMIIKVERATRAKKAKALNQKYNGGWIKYGYTTINPETKEHTKSYYIDAEKETIIKKIFELYSTGKYGIIKLHDELLSIGINVDIRTLPKILNSYEYTGEVINDYQYKRTIKGKETIINRYQRSYPPIISKELFDKCREVARKNNTNIDKSKNNIYYGNKLIRCSCCASSMIAMKSSGSYLCMHKYSKQSKKECNGNDSININAMDSILWDVASQLEFDLIHNFSEKQITDWEMEIDELQTKIDNSDKQLEIIKSTKKKQYRKIISTLSDKELESLVLKETQSDGQRIEQEKVNYRHQIDRLNNLIREAKIKYDLTGIPLIETEKVFPEKKSIMKQLNNSTEKQRYDLIHKHIKKVTISKLPELKTVKRIDVECYNAKASGGYSGSNTTYYYAYKAKDKSKRIYKTIHIVHKDMDGNVTDLEEKEYISNKRTCIQ